MSIPLNLTTVGLNNEPYSSDDVHLIQESLSDTEQALHHIKNAKLKLVELRDRTIQEIAQAEAEEERLSQTVERYKAALAPHRHLPEGILRDVFALLARDFGPVYFPLHRNEKAPPQFIVSHVCTKWRRTALGARDLWSNVYILEQINDERHIQRHQRWLSRAGNRQITLGIDLTTIEWLSDHTVAQLVQRIIMPFRVSILHLKLSNKQLSELDALPRAVLSHLDELKVTFTSYYDDHPHIRDLPHFTERTRAVDFSKAIGIRDLNILLLPLFPWDQLRTLMLRFAGMTLFMATSLLHQTPMLENLYLFVRYNRDDPFPERVSLLHLRKLALELPHNASYVDRMSILQQFQCPILINFVIHCNDAFYGTGETYDIVKRQYNLSGLEGVDFSGGYPLPVSVILKDAPMLRKLALPNYAVLDEKAIEGISSGVLGRFLTSLRFHGTREDVEEILNMAKARCMQTTSMIQQQGCSWREEISVVKKIQFDLRKEESIRYAEHISTLKHMGVDVVPLF